MFSIALSSEETQKDRDIFYSRHNDASGWRHYNWKASPEHRERLSAIWEKFVNTQNGRDLDDYSMAPGTNKIEKLFLSQLPALQKEDAILLLGTGTGREVAFLKNKGFVNARGVTLGPRNLRFAEEIIGLEASSLLFEDMHFLPFPPESFSALGGFQVLEHCLSPLLMLIECHRLLKSNGKLILQSPPSTTHTDGAELHHVLCPIPLQTRGLLLKAGFTGILFYVEGNGERTPGYKEEPLFPLSLEEEDRADIEYLVVCQKK